jgi:hypothetical protein
MKCEKNTIERAPSNINIHVRIDSIEDKHLGFWTLILDQIMTYFQNYI